MVMVIPTPLSEKIKENSEKSWILSVQWLIKYRKCLVLLSGGTLQSLSINFRSFERVGKVLSGLSPFGEGSYGRLRDVLVME